MNDFSELHQTLVSIVTVMGLIGMPTLFGCIVWCIKKFAKFFESLNYIQSAIKSIIRNQLIQDYEMYKKRGSITEIERTEFINRYINYHNLYGENGVLDDRYKEIIKM